MNPHEDFILIWPQRKKEDKPISHFQFGGKEPNKQYVHSLNPRIGIPRIPYPPIDFIILFNMMLRQFKTKITSRFYDNREWIYCVKKVNFIG